MAHTAIGMSLLRARRTGARPAEDPTVLGWVLDADPLRHDRRRGELLLRSYVRCYLQDFQLPPPWRLEAVERRWSHGRIDLLFRNVWTDQFIGDEIKTSRGRPGVANRNDLEQVWRYLTRLRGEFGQRLLGVRLVMLGPPAQAHLYESTEEVAGLIRDLDLATP